MDVRRVRVAPVPADIKGGAGVEGVCGYCGRGVASVAATRLALREHT